MTIKFHNKFCGKNDFKLWKIKIEVILIQQRCITVIKGETNMSKSLSKRKDSPN